MKSLWKLVFGLAVATAVQGCGDGNSPKAGTLSVVLVVAQQPAGAVLLTISGGPITSISPSGSYHLYDGRQSRTSHNVLLTGNILSGNLATVTVPDVGRASDYDVTIVQAAAPATAVQPYSQLLPSAFSVTIQ